MEFKRRLQVNSLWFRIWGFVTIMFLVFLSDAMIADFVPGYLQKNLGSALLMGIIMSTSSIAGLTIDLLFAKILRDSGIRKMIQFSIIGFLGFVALLYLSTFYPIVLIFISAMAVWGLYYELFGFTSQKFVVAIASPSERTSVWSILESSRAIAYAIGPIFLGYVSMLGDRNTLIVCAFMSVFTFLIFIIIKIEEKIERVVNHKELTIWHELGHWVTLSKNIWPMVVIGIVLGIVDATFWTTGTIVNDMLAERSPYGGFFLTIYMISSFFVGIFLGNKSLKSGKKKLAEIFILLSGTTLTFMTSFDQVWWYLLIVFVSSLLSALSWPLIDATYTDLLARMGKHQAHIVGLKNASYSISYIIGPVIAGLLAVFVGEIRSFTYLGWFLVFTSIILLIFTPKKLKIPQAEVAKWE